jgi:hypothetical protein
MLSNPVRTHLHGCLLTVNAVNGNVSQLLVTGQLQTDQPELQTASTCTPCLESAVLAWLWLQVALLLLLLPAVLHGLLLECVCARSIFPMVQQRGSVC